MNTQKIRNLFQSIPRTGVSIMDFLGVGPSERVDVILYLPGMPGMEGWL